MTTSTITIDGITLPLTTLDRLGAVLDEHGTTTTVVWAVDTEPAPLGYRCHRRTPYLRVTIDSDDGPWDHAYVPDPNRRVEWEAHYCNRYRSISYVGPDHAIRSVRRKM